MQNYTHAMVRRFDRCTTCHQLMQRTLPGQPLDPAYIHQRDLVMHVTPPGQRAAGSRSEVAAASSGWRRPSASAWRAKAW